MSSPRCRALALESLDDRRVLSSFTVLNTNDSGAGSLRQAIADANASVGVDVIDFRPGVRGTIKLSSGRLAITDAVDLRGLGAGIIEVSGNNVSQVFHVTADTTISGLTISGGASLEGGGIYNSGHKLIVRDCLFTRNTGANFSGSDNSVVIGTISYSVLVGSGIYNTNGGVVTVSGTTFYNNNGSGIFNDSVLPSPLLTLAVNDSSFAYNRGGGVVNTGRMTVKNSTFSMNTGAETTGTQSNGMPFTRSVGSGIGNYNGGEVTVSASNFYKNVGSGIWNYDPVPFNFDSPQMPSPTTKAIVVDSNFAENIAGSGGGILSYGGVLEVNGSTFADNSAVGLSQAAGGGINSGAGGSLTVTNSTFSGNKSLFGGGMSITFGVSPAVVTNTTLSGNSASSSGGGVFHFRSPLTLSNTIVANNTSNVAGTHDLASFDTVTGTFSGILTGTHNLIEDPGFSRPTLISTVKGDPNLGQFANYGGSTRTMPLLPGSVAIDAGNDEAVPADVLDLDGDRNTDEKLPMDQRRFSRFVRTVDIGAFEAPGHGLDGHLGTPSDDVIIIAKGNLPGTYKTTVNGVVTNNVAVDGILLVRGLGGNDSVTILESLAGGIVVDGGNDSDSYTINYGALVGPVTVTDTGVAGSDSITVNGTGEDDVITKSSELSGTAVYIRRESQQPETVDATGLETVAIRGRQGNDTINDPGSDTEIFGDEGDDTLVITVTSGNGVMLDGGEGSDNYIIQAPNDDLPTPTYIGYVGSVSYTIFQSIDLPGPVRISDTGSVGSDGLTLLGTIDADKFTQAGDRIDANGETIMLTGLETLVVDGGTGTGDTFSVVGTPTLMSMVQGVSDLVIVGTPGNDQILFSPGTSADQVIAELNGVVVAASSPAGRIVAYGLAGDDHIQVAGAVDIPAWLYGDGGNDRLNAGNGGSLLIGGDGNDFLLGGGGRDVMIGGSGTDRLIGNSNSDILVAGFTRKDNRTIVGHDNFWSSVLTKWNDVDRSFQERVQILSAAGGLLPEVIDHLWEDHIDFLNGGAGDDWLVFAIDRDKGLRKS